MKTRHLISLFSSGLIAAGMILGLPALAAASESENGSWPTLETTGIMDILEKQVPDEKHTESADTSTDILPVPGSQNAASDPSADLQQLFGNLPRYLDLGSFTLNRLNGIPVPSLTPDGMLLDSNTGICYQIRPSWKGLQDRISSILEECAGDWSVYLKDLKTGNTIKINEHPMRSASLIKLFIAGTTYELIEKGELEETDTIRTALYDMITVSDNESANVLVRSFCDDSGDFQTGLAKVNDFISRHGFSNTIQVNGIADPSLWVSDGRINETSAADCGRLLEMIYDGELVSHFASYRFENLLNNQQVNYKIPAALPDTAHISHKTGEDDDTENDAAIIYTPYGDYILCIMSTKASDTGASVDTIHTLTRLIHQWFTEPVKEWYPIPESMKTEIENGIVEYDGIVVAYDSYHILKYKDSFYMDYNPCQEENAYGHT